MTDTALKLALAKMLPEVITVSRCGDIHWLRQSDKGSWLGDCVRDTELLHLVSLAEAKLTPDEYGKYFNNLCSLFTWGKPPLERMEDYWFSVITATWQQCTIALFQTKGIMP